MNLIALIILWIWMSVSWRGTKKRLEAEREANRIKREEEAARRAVAEAERQKQEMFQAQYRLSCVSSIFSTDPWQRWSGIDHTFPPQAERIRRAYETSNMQILSYCPSDSSAVIQGDSWMRYKTSPSGCECPDFSKRRLPCKHMYYLARKLFDGFDDLTIVGEQHTCLSTAELEREKRRLADKKMIENSIPHKNIIAYVEKHGPITRRQIVEAFSVLNEKDVRRAIQKLYDYGLIQGEKRSGTYYHWVESDSESSNAKS